MNTDWEFVFLHACLKQRTNSLARLSNVIKIRIELRTRKIFIKRVRIIVSPVVWLPIAKMKPEIGETRAKVVKQKRNDRQMFVSFIAITCEGLGMHLRKVNATISVVRRVCENKTNVANTWKMSVESTDDAKFLCGFYTFMCRVVKRYSTPITHFNATKILVYCTRLGRRRSDSCWWSHWFAFNLVWIFLKNSIRSLTFLGSENRKHILTFVGKGFITLFSFASPSNSTEILNYHQIEIKLLMMKKFSRLKCGHCLIAVVACCNPLSRNSSPVIIS